jgi:hypothetical protein
MRARGTVFPHAEESGVPGSAWRFIGLRTWQAVLCLLLGFLLAATSAAPEISRAVTSIIGLLSGR